MQWIFQKLIGVSVALAQANQNPSSSANQNPIVFPNPLGASNIADLINTIINFLIVIGAPLLTLMVIIGGGQIMFAVGDPKKFETGKKTIVYAVIGFGILLVSKGVALLVQNILTGAPSPNLDPGYSTGV